ncbi:hypothetical protein HDU67_004546 [Dinochytrium kinnereticum]|nr:hypothetical protein HDU67_004546 [Dinochytrium kinnereticum]
MATTPAIDQLSEAAAASIAIAAEDAATTAGIPQDVVTAASAAVHEKTSSSAIGFRFGKKTTTTTTLTGGASTLVKKTGGFSFLKRQSPKAGGSGADAVVNAADDDAGELGVVTECEKVGAMVASVDVSEKIQEGLSEGPAQKKVKTIAAAPVAAATAAAGVARKKISLPAMFRRKPASPAVAGVDADAAAAEVRKEDDEEAAKAEEGAAAEATTHTPARKPLLQAFFFKDRPLATTDHDAAAAAPSPASAAAAAAEDVAEKPPVDIDDVVETAVGRDAEAVLPSPPTSPIKTIGRKFSKLMEKKAAHRDAPVVGEAVAVAAQEIDAEETVKVSSRKVSKRTSMLWFGSQKPVVKGVEAVKVEEAVEIAVVEEAAENAVVEEAKEIAVVKEASEIAVVEEAAENAVVEEAAENAVVEEAAENAVVEEAHEKVVAGEAAENAAAAAQVAAAEATEKVEEVVQEVTEAVQVEKNPEPTSPTTGIRRFLSFTKKSGAAAAAKVVEDVKAEVEAKAEEAQTAVVDAAVKADETVEKVAETVAPKMSRKRSFFRSFTGGARKMESEGPGGDEEVKSATEGIEGVAVVPPGEKKKFFFGMRRKGGAQKHSGEAAGVTTVEAREKTEENAEELVVATDRAVDAEEIVPVGEVITTQAATAESVDAAPASVDVETKEDVEKEEEKLEEVVPASPVAAEKKDLKKRLFSIKKKAAAAHPIDAVTATVAAVEETATAAVEKAEETATTTFKKIEETTTAAVEKGKEGAVAEVGRTVEKKIRPVSQLFGFVKRNNASGEIDGDAGVKEEGPSEEGEGVGSETEGSKVEELDGEIGGGKRKDVDEKRDGQLLRSPSLTFKFFGNKKKHVPAAAEPEHGKAEVSVQETVDEESEEKDAGGKKRSMVGPFQFLAKKKQKPATGVAEAESGDVKDTAVVEKEEEEAVAPATEGTEEKEEKGETRVDSEKKERRGQHFFNFSMKKQDSVAAVIDEAATESHPSVPTADDHDPTATPDSPPTTLLTRIGSLFKKKTASKPDSPVLSSEEEEVIEREVVVSKPYMDFENLVKPDPETDEASALMVVVVRPVKAWVGYEGMEVGGRVFVAPGTPVPPTK